MMTRGLLRPWSFLVLIISVASWLLVQRRNKPMYLHLWRPPSLEAGGTGETPRDGGEDQTIPGTCRQKGIQETKKSHWGGFTGGPFGTKGKTEKTRRTNPHPELVLLGLFFVLHSQLTFLPHLNHKAGGNFPHPRGPHLESGSVGGSGHHPTVNLSLSEFPSACCPPSSHLPSVLRALHRQMPGLG